MTNNPASVGPAPDGEGWIEWSGETDCPVDRRAMVDVRVKNGEIVTDEGRAFDWWTIAAYRLHAPHPGREAEPCFECGSTERIGTACKPCNPEITDPTFGAEPTGGVGDLEQRAFHAANQPQSVEVYQQLVRDLWRAFCKAEAHSVSPPVVEGSSLRDTQPGAEGAVLVLKEPTTELMAEFANIDGPWCRGHMNCEQVWAALLDAQAEGTARDRHQPTTPGEQETDLDDLLKRSVEAFKTLPPAERRRMIAAQRASYVRGMTTPCEHGVLDFEQCGDCRSGRPGQGEEG